MADRPGADRTGPRTSSSRVLPIALTAYTAFVLIVTMWPDPGDPATSWSAAALVWLHALGLPRGVDLTVVEALANVAMFVPLGALALLVTRLPQVAVLAAGAMFSTLIELTQLAVLPHRFATVQDVVMNTLGALVGVALASLVRPRATVETAPADEAGDG